MGMNVHIEHARIESSPGGLMEWEVADETTGNSTYPREELIWVQLYGCGASAGRWMTPDEAEAFAAAILEVAAKHQARLKLSGLDSEKDSLLLT